MMMADDEPMMERPDPAPRRRGLLPLLGAVLVLVAFVCAVWYAYHMGREAGGDAAVPLIAADPGPAKVRPADPGGLDVPNRDKLVYQRLSPQTAAPIPEHLLPPPEQPLPKPPPPPASATGLAPAPGAETAAEAPAGPEQSISEGVTAMPEQPEPQPPAETAPAMPAPTGDAAAPAEPPAPPPAPPAAGGGYRVQLASLRSEADAREAWTRLRSAHSDLLGRLQLSIERADLGAGKGVYYRVQAGPLSEKTLAEMLCGELKTRNVGCIIVQP